MLALNSNRFCDEVPLETVMDPVRPTLNQSLAGAPSPRTRIPPVMVAPVTELGYWSADPTRRWSHINTRTTQYPRASGWETCAVPLQPEMYTLSRPTQPINATNGIAVTPCAADVTLLVDADAPNLANVYDPRFTGYGAPDRAYTDPLLGNTRYFYDDVDAIRMPRYITRNKIDTCVQTRGDAYGDVDAGNLALDTVRPIVERDWRDQSLAFREDMMSRLMKKRNEELLQTRAAPKYTLW